MMRNVGLFLFSARKAWLPVETLPEHVYTAASGPWTPFRVDPAGPGFGLSRYVRPGAPSARRVARRQLAPPVVSRGLRGADTGGQPCELRARPRSVGPDLCSQ